MSKEIHRQQISGAGGHARPTASQLKGSYLQGGRQMQPAWLGERRDAVALLLLPGRALDPLSQGRHA